MSRNARSFERQKAKFKPQPRTLVICEDTKSCLIYLKQAARYFRAYADIEISHCGRTDPPGIVAEAAKRKARYDKVYCAIDRDGHLGFAQALAVAAAKGIEVVASYPSYEFWLLLHFRRTRSAFMPAGKKSAGDRLVETLKREVGMADYQKGSGESLFEDWLSRLSHARQVSPQVLAEAVADGELNPSTRLHELIDYLELLGSPQAI